MQNPSLVPAIAKLAIAGEQGGVSVEQMIRLLDDGLTIETLLGPDLVASGAISSGSGCNR